MRVLIITTAHQLMSKSSISQTFVNDKTIKTTTTSHMHSICTAKYALRTRQNRRC